MRGGYRDSNPSALERDWAFPGLFSYFEEFQG